MINTHTAHQVIKSIEVKMSYNLNNKTSSMLYVQTYERKPNITYHNNTRTKCAKLLT